MKNNPKKAKELINLDLLSKIEVASKFLDSKIKLGSLEFSPDSGLSPEKLAILNDWQLGVGGGAQFRYNPDVKILKMEDHLARVNLLAELAGIKRYIDNPRMDARLVFKSKDAAELNEKGFSYHFHTSAVDGTPMTSADESKVLQLARILALKKDDWRQVGTREMWRKGLNKFGASFEWRDHYLSPKEEAEIAQKVMSLDAEGRNEYFKTELNKALRDPVVLQRFIESLEDPSRPLFLKSWESSTMESLLDPENGRKISRQKIETLKMRLANASPVEVFDTFRQQHPGHVMLEAMSEHKDKLLQGAKLRVKNIDDPMLITDWETQKARALQFYGEELGNILLQAERTVCAELSEGEIKSIIGHALNSRGKTSLVSQLVASQPRVFSKSAQEFFDFSNQARTWDVGRANETCGNLSRTRRVYNFRSWPSLSK